MYDNHDDNLTIRSSSTNSNNSVAVTIIMFTEIESDHITYLYKLSPIEGMNEMWSVAPPITNHVDGCKVGGRWKLSDW